MRRITFKVARRKVTTGAARVGAGVIVLGLALSASGGRKTAASINKTQTRSHRAATRSGPWYEFGVASWYGPHFQGRKTATGERFDMNLMTCAHPTLPLGTWLRVTNLKTRKTALVRVNDRGPVVDGRIVDLSYAAAQAVGLQGVGRVKLEKVHATDPQVAQELVAQLHMPSLVQPLVP